MKNSAKDAVCVTAACVNARRRKCTNKGTTMPMTRLERCCECVNK